MHLKEERFHLIHLIGWSQRLSKGKFLMGYWHSIFMWRYLIVRQRYRLLKFKRILRFWDLLLSTENNSKTIWNPLPWNETKTWNSWSISPLSQQSNKYHLNSSLNILNTTASIHHLIISLTKTFQQHLVQLKDSSLSTILFSIPTRQWNSQHSITNTTSSRKMASNLKDTPNVKTTSWLRTNYFKLSNRKKKRRWEYRGYRQWESITRKRINRIKSLNTSRCYLLRMRIIAES